MPHEGRGPEQELAAADRGAEDDDAGPGDLEPLETAGNRGSGQFGARPRIQARTRFDGGRFSGGWMAKSHSS